MQSCMLEGGGGTCFQGNAPAPTCQAGLCERDNAAQHAPVVAHFHARQRRQAAPQPLRQLLDAVPGALHADAQAALHGGAQPDLRAAGGGSRRMIRSSACQVALEALSRLCACRRSDGVVAEQLLSATGHCCSYCYPPPLHTPVPWPRSSFRNSQTAGPCFAAQYRCALPSWRHRYRARPAETCPWYHCTRKRGHSSSELVFVCRPQTWLSAQCKQLGGKPARSGGHLRQNRKPLPREPRRYLRPVPHRKSQPMRCTSMGIWPTLWVASSMKSTPAARHSAPTPAASYTRPAVTAVAVAGRGTQVHACSSSKHARFSAPGWRYF